MVNAAVGVTTANANFVARAVDIAKDMLIFLTV